MNVAEQRLLIYKKTDKIKQAKAESRNLYKCRQGLEGNLIKSSANIFFGVMTSVTCGGAGAFLVATLVREKNFGAWFFVAIAFLLATPLPFKSVASERRQKQNDKDNIQDINRRISDTRKQIHDYKKEIKSLKKAIREYESNKAQQSNAINNVAVNVK